MNAHDFKVRTAGGAYVAMKEFAGRVLLVVNVASKCGLTPQYEGLEALYRTNRAAGLSIVGFPCNQFGGQEPGMDEEIQQFCSTNYDVTFPVMAKVDVNGPQADPLFVHLRRSAPGDFGPDAGRLYDHISSTRPEALGTDQIKWNFTKFLIDRDGTVVRRFEPNVEPADIQPELAAVL
jgi:glutathione peroxidase